MNALEIRDLSKRFGRIEAVRNLSLTVGKGEMFALVGPDGAGKTTTIRILCGLLRPTAGSVSVMGYDVIEHADFIKEHIGYLSQRFTLYGDLSVDENIEFFAEINRVSNYRKRRDELLQFTRLKPFRDRLADRLSGGMKQKLALACTLIHTPEVLILDEPTTGVDPVSRRDLWRILHDLQVQGMTIMMSTPYLDEAERCNRVGLLNEGHLMVADEPHNLKSLMKGDIIEVVCSQIRDARRLLQHHPAVNDVHMFGDRLNLLVKTASKDAIPLVSMIQSKGIQVTSWRLLPPSLENIFISMVKSSETQEVQT